MEPEYYSNNGYYYIGCDSATNDSSYYNGYYTDNYQYDYRRYYSSNVEISSELSNTYKKFFKDLALIANFILDNIKLIPASNDDTKLIVKHLLEDFNHLINYSYTGNIKKIAPVYSLFLKIKIYEPNLWINPIVKDIDGKFKEMYTLIKDFS